MFVIIISETAPFCEMINQFIEQEQITQAQ